MLDTVSELVVKSLICQPVDGGKVPAGSTRIAGMAWTGPGRNVERVEIRVDEGPWELARLTGREEPDCWQSWEFPWVATPGRHVIATRATDRRGNTQPEVTPWNRGGYLWNGIDRVRVETAEE
jgi:hypothetical protein